MTCLNELRDALFADVVLLVEGTSDRALYEGIAARDRVFAMDGIEVAAAWSKSDLFLPHAILRLLGISVHAVFDNDRGVKQRMIDNPKKLTDPDEIEKAAVDQEKATKRLNRKLLRYFGQSEEDWPAGQISADLTVIDDIIETVIDARWPEFAAECQRLIDDGRVVNEKDSATYRLVAAAADNPPLEFGAVVATVRALVPN